MGPDRRGEVWLVDLGHAAKTRPAVVISVPALDTERALVTLVPHTTSPRGTRYEVASHEPYLKPAPSMHRTRLQCLRQKCSDDWANLHQRILTT
jgi:hypothetical protein